MALPDAVVILNRSLEKSAVDLDFDLLNKLAFVKKQIMDHQCAKRRKNKK